MKIVVCQAIASSHLAFSSSLLAANSQLPPLAKYVLAVTAAVDILITISRPATPDDGQPSHLSAYLLVPVNIVVASCEREELPTRRYH